MPRIFMSAQPALIRGHASKLALLDLARALAATWVLGAHLCYLQGWPVYPFYEGRIPVDVFIFLSGFLMFHLLDRQQQAGSVREALGFYVRRFFRIAPCFYVALLAYLCFRGFYARSLVRAEDHFGMSGSFTSSIVPLTTSDVVAHFTFLHGLWQGPGDEGFRASLDFESRDAVLRHRAPGCLLAEASSSHHLVGRFYDQRRLLVAPWLLRARRLASTPFFPRFPARPVFSVFASAQPLAFIIPIRPAAMPGCSPLLPQARCSSSHSTA